MSGRFTISQLAHAARVPTTTVRYSERVGLVQPEGRSAGNYRLYPEESLRMLEFIWAAQAIGFTLDELKALFSAARSTASPCKDVQSLSQKQLVEVDQRLRDLLHVQRVLRASLEECKATRQTECCPVIETLREKSRAK